MAKDYSKPFLYHGFTLTIHEFYLIMSLIIKTYYIYTIKSLKHKHSEKST